MTVATAITVGTALAEAAAQLSSAGISDARREARLLVATALDWDAARVLGFPEAEMTTAAGERLATLLARRSAREPISRILGHREFWSLRFELSPDTLDPRPDSETLIEAALAVLEDRDRAYRVLDFGTGTGCLLLALLSELPRAIGTGVDLSDGALEMARRNAAVLGLGGRAQFLCGNWGDPVSGAWDVILANPPYIASDDIGRLSPEVARFEPRRALDGGRDGLSAYRLLAPTISRLLASSGVAVIEIGAGQAQKVAALMAGAGLALRAIRHDLSGVDRCLVLGRD
ncbi:MAG TPA: peptide chain release factor N(5)-glutamine methyltransferase [Stellaceae bacterium]|nr:peptide chain release factor N(5)-glutamine methyltransferase [Stellaceae bacterium]